MDHLEQADEQDNFMDQELYRFRAIIGHEGPLKATDPNWKGSKWNVQIEWETGEITFEPLSVIAADDPITCAAYAKEKNLYNLDGWKRFRHLIKKEKQLTRAIRQSKIRQVRHAKKYMFGFLIPRNYTEALEFDKANNNSKWYDATKAELDSIHSYEVFQKHEKAQYDKQKKVINAPQDIRKSEFILFLQSSIVVKLQFSFYLDLHSQEIYNYLGCSSVFPKDCLFTCIFHSL